MITASKSLISPADFDIQHIMIYGSIYIQNGTFPDKKLPLFSLSVEERPQSCPNRHISTPKITPNKSDAYGKKAFRK